MDTVRIVILGGGFAGIGTAKRLLKLRGKDDNWHITLVDKNTFHTYTPSLYEVATGYGDDRHFSEDAGSVVGIPYSAIFRKDGISLVRGEVVGIDAEKSEVTLRDGSVLSFDYCAAALGGVVDFFGVQGAAEYAYPLKTFADAHRLHAALRALTEAGGQKYIVTVGGGFSGIETTAELACCLDKLCRDCAMPRERIVSTIVESNGEILPGVHPRVRSAVLRRLRELGIRIVTGHRVTRADGDSVELDSGKTLPSHLTIWSTGLRVADAVGRRIAIDEFLRSKDHAHIFALGDNALFAGKDGTPVPQTASIAVRQAPIAAENIAHSIRGEECVPYAARFPGFVVPVGGKFAVAQVGGMVITGFFARFLHEFIAWRYYLSILPFIHALRLLLRGSHLFLRND